MHPSASVIFFTVASGAGYGLLVALGLGVALGWVGGTLGITALVVSGVLVTAGLLSSTLHLGHPERAWRAVSQWRTSWLSREGVAALATYLPMAGLMLCFLLDANPVLFAVLAALGAALTVWCTGMIYAALKPIREWHTPWTAPGYMAFSAATGFTLAHALVLGFGRTDLAAFSMLLAVVGIVAAFIAHRARRAFLIETLPLSTRASAIGVRGTVRPLDPPHTGTNYLLQEMGYRLGRKHRLRLSALMAALAFAAPAVLAVGSALVPGGAVLAGFAALAVLIGTAVERWLFFATATHTVGLYYR